MASDTWTALLTTTTPGEEVAMTSTLDAAPMPSGLSAARVAYLEAAYDLLRESLLPEAPDRARTALAYSFPSRGAHSTDGRGRIGECHWGSLAGSATGERILIVVHPSEWSDDTRVLAVLAHEMVHASLGREIGHRAPFAALARRIGLDGRPAATFAGSAFTRWVDEKRGRLPSFPAGALTLAGRRIQGTRLRLYECGCPRPVKIRCARDDLRATCNCCGKPFALMAGKTAARTENGVLSKQSSLSLERG